MPLSMIQNSVRRDKFKNQHGVALILVAVIAMFLGVFATLGLGFLQLKEGPDIEKETRLIQKRAVNHLASFVHMNDRLPCPADPSVVRTAANFGLEDRTGPGTACRRTEGLYPFRSLALNERDALDGWSRFFTYRISPVFSNNDPAQIPDTGIDVYAECLTRGIWITETTHVQTREGGTEQTAVNVNRNPRKAKFCCPANGNDGFAADGTDIQLRTANGTDLIQPRTGFNTRTSAPAQFSDIDDFVDPPTGNVSAWAFVLLSHGSNGLGAFQVNGTTDRAGAPVGDEAENADDDRIFIDRAASRVAGAAYYDDILVSMTQNGLYGHLNNGSCARPFR